MIPYKGTADIVDVLAGTRVQAHRRKRDMKPLLSARDRIAVNRAAPIGFATIRPADGEKFV